MKRPCLILLATFVAISASADLVYSFSHDECVTFGNDLRWSVSATNASAAASLVAASFSVDWLQYDGQALGSVFESASTNVIPPFSSTNFECRVPVETYRSYLSGSETFECTVGIWNVSDEDEDDSETMRSYVEADNGLSVRIVPVPLPALGESASVIVQWTNTTPFSVHTVFSISLDDSLRTAEGHWLCQWPTNEIPPGGVATMQTNAIVRGPPPFPRRRTCRRIPSRGWRRGSILRNDDASFVHKGDQSQRAKITI